MTGRSSRLPASDRHSYILSELQQNGRVLVEDLARALDTSEVTIRKDLTQLEAEGHLLRRHGGALPRIDLKQSGSSEQSELSERKLMIATAAAALVQDHSRILIDFGSTTTAMIPHLQARQGLVIMTNSLRTAEAVLALEPPPTLLMTGGTWDAQTRSLQGQIAEQILGSYDFDQLFIGCDGLDPLRGTTTFNELLGLSRLMAGAAREVIVMATSDKAGRRIPNLELPWSKVNILITDAGLDADVRQQIEQQGVRVISAPLQENK